MKNVRFIIGFSIFGFLLSFLASFRTVARSFGMRLVIALCFAAGFAVLAAVINVVAEKLLGINTADSDSSLNAPVNKPSNGNSVDIVIQDEDLPSEEDGAQFFVGSNHQMLNSEDLEENQKKSGDAPETEKSESDEKKSTAVSEKDLPSADLNTNKNTVAGISLNADAVRKANVDSENSGFVPVTAKENAENFSSVESKTVSEIKADENVTQMNSVPDLKNENTAESLDVLPDLEEISEGNVSLSTSNEQDNSEQTDFSGNKNSISSKKENADGNDAELMAKAISTLLSKDKEE